MRFHHPAVLGLHGEKYDTTSMEPRWGSLRGLGSIPRVRLRRPWAELFDPGGVNDGDGDFGTHFNQYPWQTDLEPRRDWNVQRRRRCTSKPRAAQHTLGTQNHHASTNPNDPDICLTAQPATRNKAFWCCLSKLLMITRVRRTHPWIQSSGSPSPPARAGSRKCPGSLRRLRMTKSFKGFIALWPIPEMRRGGIPPPSPVSAPGSALGSRPRVALSSAQVASVYRRALGPGKGSLLGRGPPPRLDRQPFALPGRPR